jgi:hypothetical protein
MFAAILPLLIFALVHPLTWQQVGVAGISLVCGTALLIDLNR